MNTCVFGHVSRIYPPIHQSATKRKNITTMTFPIPSRFTTVQSRWNGTSGNRRGRRTVTPTSATAMPASEDRHLDDPPSYINLNFSRRKTVSRKSGATGILYDETTSTTHIILTMKPAVLHRGMHRHQALPLAKNKAENSTEDPPPRRRRRRSDPLIVWLFGKKKHGEYHDRAAAPYPLGEQNVSTQQRWSKIPNESKRGNRTQREKKDEDDFSTDGLVVDRSIGRLVD
jgi:hypothetical protein